jgi:hypothetical protein
MLSNLISWIFSTVILAGSWNGAATTDTFSLTFDNEYQTVTIDHSTLEEPIVDAPYRTKDDYAIIVKTEKVAGGLLLVEFVDYDDDNDSYDTATIHLTVLDDGKTVKLGAVDVIRNK